MSFPSEWLEAVSECVLCGGREASPWLTARCPERPQETFPIVECSGCGLRYLSLRPSPASIATYYDSGYYSYSFHGVRPRSHRLKVRLWRAVRLLPPPREVSRWGGMVHGLVRRALGPRAAWLLPAPTAGRRFLDLGSGAGERLELARDLGWETYGLDLGQQAVADAATRGHRTVAGDIQALPFAAQSLDYINLSHVLEHAYDPLQVLRECRRVVRESGVIQIVVPNAGGWGAGHYGEHWRALDVPRHLYHFTAATVRRLVEAAGLQVAVQRTLPDDWVLEESRATAGESTASPADRKRWRRLAGAGQGENLDTWCTRPSDL